MHLFDIENTAEINSSLNTIPDFYFGTKRTVEVERNDVMVLRGLITLITFCMLTGGWSTAFPGDPHIFQLLVVNSSYNLRALKEKSGLLQLALTLLVLAIIAIGNSNL